MTTSPAATNGGAKGIKMYLGQGLMWAKQMMPQAPEPENKIFYDDTQWDDRDGADGDDNCFCSTCGGDGWGIVGVDFDSDDYINGPFDGEITRCPNCHGSGRAEDMTYW